MTIQKKSRKIAKPKKAKKNERKLSPKQQKVVKIIEENMADNSGFTKGITKKEVLKKAGYSKSVQATPEKVFASASMKKAMRKVGLDLRSLKIKHKQLLNFCRVEKIECSLKIPAEEFVNMIIESIPGAKFLHFWENSIYSTRTNYFLIPDVVTQSRMLEMQYKILGEFAPEKHAITDTDGNDVHIYLPSNNREGNKKLKK